jgi:protein-S-isoprenylcysteine O-methyltransferase Ste14
MIDPRANEPERTLPNETARVIAPPPLLYLASIAAGWGLSKIDAAPVVPESAALPVGLPIIALSLGLFVAALRELRRARTPIPTRRPTTAIVTTGPYRFTRNPVYLAFSLLQAGIGFATNNGWMFAMTVLSIVVMTWGVIAREERYLERRFGREYVEYKRTARRWL